MNSLASTLSLPFTWLSRFRLTYPTLLTQAASGPETHHLHLAFHRAYRSFAQTHPQWINRRLDADLLRPALVERWGDDLAHSNAAHMQRLAMQVALRWDAQFGCLYTTETRIRQIEELKVVAVEFLRLFQDELANDEK